ncbi:MAG: PQQ-binding-like beta-propeller repeat protein [Planctomycetota bacterium]
MQSLTKLVAPLLLSINVASPHAADDWTQWRGPDRTGKIVDEAWPQTLDESRLQARWRTPMGASYSGPLITADTIYTTESSGDKEYVKALDRQTGKQTWQAEWIGSMTVPFFAAANGSWIRATPALDGDDLFVAGMRDVLVCLDASTGDIRWKADFTQALNSPVPSFGLVCSPLVDGGFVYVQAGGGFLKVDRNSGKVVWKSLDDGGGMYGSAFSSPIIVELAGTRQAVVQTRQKLAGVDLESGKELWSTPVEAFRGMNILTPTVIGNRVFTSTYGGGSFLFNVTRSENRSYSVRQVWRNKVQGYMSSPVVIDGHVYLHLRNQRFACINLETGKEAWITTPFGKYWSLIANGKQLLALDETGELLLINANPSKFELVARRKLSDAPTWAHLAIAGNEIVVRELQALAVFDWQRK